MYPNKRHDGKVITLRGLEGTLTEGEKLSGIYVHVPRSRTFKFDYGADRLGVFVRYEWEVVKQKPPTKHSKRMEPRKTTRPLKSSMVELKVTSLDQAKTVAGEWVAMFNQDLDYNDNLFVVQINGTGKTYTVLGWWHDGSYVEGEDYHNAMDVALGLPDYYDPGIFSE